MKKKAYVTKHAAMRGEQRLGGVSQTDANLAFCSGLDAHEFKGELSRFLLEKSSGAGHYVAKVRGDAVYIFENKLGHRLITVYRIPEEYLPIERFKIKEEELGPRCIMLSDKRTGATMYLRADGSLTEDIADAVEFRSQKQAARYVANNAKIQSLLEDYDFAMF